LIQNRPRAVFFMFSCTFAPQMRFFAPHHGFSAPDKKLEPFKLEKAPANAEASSKNNYYNAFAAAMISMIQPAMNATPPIGVMAPSMLMPVKLSTYKLPEKMMIPASIK
jgi:hypothetical protein